jgi:hypothetical protein
MLAREHALNSVACRLRFTRDYRNFATNQGVGERRLADVWTSDYGNKAAMVSRSIRGGYGIYDVEDFCN